MLKEVFSSWWFVVLIILLTELVLSAPQGYDYYANQRRNYYVQAQRAAQAQRIQAQRIAEQNRYRYQQAHKSAATTTTTTTRKPNIVNRADSENAKFLGTQNQESDGSGRFLTRKTKKLFGGGYPYPYPYPVPYPYSPGCNFRDSDKKKDSQGRFLWDLNVYNVYPNSYGGGCGGGFGGGFGDGFGGGYGGFGGLGGGLADPYYPPRPVRGFFQNWLGLFLPGGALNSPYPGPSYSGLPPQSPPADLDYDASLGSTGSGANTGGAATSAPVMTNLTPGQLVSGVAGTVNNVIQQLSNRPIPVYG